MGTTVFRKKYEHLITYRNGDRASQINFLLYHGTDMKEIRNCKVIPGDHVTARHRLLVIDLAIAVRRRQKRKVIMEKRSRWFKPATKPELKTWGGGGNDKRRAKPVT